ncbi:putative integral membrane protein required for ER to Golgi transport [Papiliotrema laurentii]|uniref:Integral membrane protein required for ER to Golgi transport n=1 Tax=Papiliotrema laurentii TaxID=5418 RepID=A0AAD9L6J4_PAPLA|nr:putative integral membrane protein required for ER to Golgi transport [Papiliotrema laurentii]
MVFGYFGQIFYVALLFTNAIAVLSEDRFLAKIGWSTRTTQQANAGFGHASNPNIYDQSFGGGNEGASIKSKLINLISATRTLMRMPLIVANIAVIIYELLLG